MSISTYLGYISACNECKRIKMARKSEKRQNTDCNFSPVFLLLLYYKAFLQKESVNLNFLTMSN